MSTGPRQTGGQNNKVGNRYEDFFAAYKLLEGIPDYIDYARDIRLKEQTGSALDDLLLETVEVDYYHQLKSGQQTTWGRASGKLEKEFRDQKKECKAKAKKYQLVIVVPNEARRVSLADNIPHGLKSVTRVVIFPRVKNSGQMARQGGRTRDILTNISASTIYGQSEYQIIVETLLTRWVNHEEDADGFCCLGRLMAAIGTLNTNCRIRTDWPHQPSAWGIAQDVLNKIPGFTWTVDRGYFEWRYGVADKGLMPFPCKSESFIRFIERVVQQQPTTFDDLEAHFP